MNTNAPATVATGSNLLDQPITEKRIMCGESTPDGNSDDPTYAFCGLTRNHGGEHGDWRF